VSSWVGNMNSPARVLQEASFNDGGLGADANSDNALSVAWCVNGECHGNPISNTHTRTRLDSGRRYGAGPASVRRSCCNAQRRTSRICWPGGVGLCTGPWNPPAPISSQAGPYRFDDRYVSELSRRWPNWTKLQTPQSDQLPQRSARRNWFALGPPLSK